MKLLIFIYRRHRCKHRPDSATSLILPMEDNAGNIVGAVKTRESVDFSQIVSAAKSKETKEMSSEQKITSQEEASFQSSSVRKSSASLSLASMSKIQESSVLYLGKACILVMILHKF